MNVTTINRITYKRQAGIGSCCGRTIFYTACMIAEYRKIATRYGSADPGPDGAGQWIISVM